MQSRFNSLRLSMFQGDEKGFPCLKGNAAELRHFAPALLAALRKYMDPNNRQQEQMAMMLEISDHIETLLDEHADCNRFDAATSAAFERLVFGFAQTNTDLGNHFHRQGMTLFHHTIKYHYMLHLAKGSRHMNPRLAWCYSGEDPRRKMKVLVQGSNRGSPPAVVIRRTLEKYIRGLCMSLQGLYIRR